MTSGSRSSTVSFHRVVTVVLATVGWWASICPMIFAADVCPPSAPRCDEAARVSIFNAAYDFDAVKKNDESAWSYGFAADNAFTSEFMPLLINATSIYQVLGEPAACWVTAADGSATVTDDTASVCHSSSALTSSPLHDESQLWLRPGPSCELVTVRWALHPTSMRTDADAPDGPMPATIEGSFLDGASDGDTTGFVFVNDTLVFVAASTRIHPTFEFDALLWPGARVSFQVGCRLSPSVTGLNVTIRLWHAPTNIAAGKPPYRRCPFGARRCVGGYAQFDLREDMDFAHVAAVNQTQSSIWTYGWSEKGDDVGRNFTPLTLRTRSGTIHSLKRVADDFLQTAVDLDAPWVSFHPGNDRQSARARWALPMEPQLPASKQGAASVDADAVTPPVTARVNGSFTMYSFGDMICSVVLNAGAQQRRYYTIQPSVSFDFLIPVTPGLSRVDFVVGVNVADQNFGGTTLVAAMVTVYHDRPYSPPCPMGATRCASASEERTRVGSWDAAADFDFMNNPGVRLDDEVSASGLVPSPWSYLRSQASMFYNFSSFRPLSEKVITNPFAGWQSEASYPLIAKEVMSIRGAGAGSSELMGHPGPNGESAILRWTSPVSGLANVRGGYTRGSMGDTMGFVLVNGVPRFVAGSTNLEPSFNVLSRVDIGDTVDVMVAYLNGYAFGLTGLRATVEVDSTGSQWICPFGARTCRDQLPLFNVADDFDFMNNPSVDPPGWSFGYNRMNDKEVEDGFILAKLATQDTGKITYVTSSGGALGKVLPHLSSNYGVLPTQLYLHPPCDDYFEAVARWSLMPHIRSEVGRGRYDATSWRPAARLPVRLDAEVGSPSSSASPQRGQGSAASLILSIVCYCGQYFEGDRGDMPGAVWTSSAIEVAELAKWPTFLGARSSSRAGGVNSSSLRPLVLARSLFSTDWSPSFQGAFLAGEDATVQITLKQNAVSRSCSFGSTGATLQVRVIPLTGLPSCGGTGAELVASSCRMVNLSVVLPSHFTEREVDARQPRTVWHDATRDFSLLSNPSGVWSYGAWPVVQPPPSSAASETASPSTAALPDDVWWPSPPLQPPSNMARRVLSTVASTSVYSENDPTALSGRIIGWGGTPPDSVVALPVNITAPLHARSAAIGLVTGADCGCGAGVSLGVGEARHTSLGLHDWTASSAVLVMHIGAPRCTLESSGSSQHHVVAEAPVLTWRSPWGGRVAVRGSVRQRNASRLGDAKGASKEEELRSRPSSSRRGIAMALVVAGRLTRIVRSPSNLTSLELVDLPVVPGTLIELLATWTGDWGDALIPCDASHPDATNSSREVEVIGIVSVVLEVDAQVDWMEGAKRSVSQTKRDSATTSMSHSATLKIARSRTAARPAPQPSSVATPTTAIALPGPSTRVPLVGNRQSATRSAPRSGNGMPSGKRGSTTVTVSASLLSTALNPSRVDDDLLTTILVAANNGLPYGAQVALTSASVVQAAAGMWAAPMSANKGSTMGRTVKLFQCAGSNGGGETLDESRPSWDAYVWVYDASMMAQWWVATLTTTVITGAVLGVLYVRTRFFQPANVVANGRDGERDHQEPSSYLLSAFAVTLSYYLPNVVGASTATLSVPTTVANRVVAGFGAVFAASLLAIGFYANAAASPTPSSLIGRPGDKSTATTLTAIFSVLALGARAAPAAGSSSSSSSAPRRLHGCIDILVAMMMSAASMIHYTSDTQCFLALVLNAVLNGGQLGYLVYVQPLESAVDRASALVLVSANLGFIGICLLAQRGALPVAAVSTSSVVVVTVFYLQILAGIADATRKYWKLKSTRSQSRDDERTAVPSSSSVPVPMPIASEDVIGCSPSSSSWVVQQQQAPLLLEPACVGETCERRSASSSFVPKHSSPVTVDVGSPSFKTSGSAQKSLPVENPLRRV